MAAQLHAQDVPPAPPEERQGEAAAEAAAEIPAFFLLTMATESTEASDTTQLGIRDMLFGWDEMACLYFRTAVKADRDCALAWCALMLAEGPTAEPRAELERIFSEDIAYTPQEMNLLTTLLRIVRGEYSGAGEEFANRAAKYRGDILSACWAAYLLHDGYDDILGKPLPNQQRALDVLLPLYERKSQDPLVAYLRAWVEESSPKPSAEALAAAKYAAQTLPEHPSPQLLYAHLLFRNGQLDESLAALQQASKWAAEARKNVPHGTMEQVSSESYPLELWPLELCARLYESTILHLKGKAQESQRVVTDLMKAAGSMDKKYAHAPGAVLLHWEARTLPLRLLVLAPKKPTDAQVAAAVKSASAPKGDPVFDACECLRYCLVARQRAGGKRQALAIRCVESAEASFKKLEAAEAACKGQGAPMYSAWTRAMEACRMAILAAKMAVYPKTESIWKQSLEEGLRKPTSLLMPPVLPR